MPRLCYSTRAMIVYDTRVSRRLVGRLERGEKVPEAFLEIARTHDVKAGWLSALGALENVELVEYDQATQQYKTPRRIDGVLEILSFVGNLSRKDGQPFAHIHAAVSRDLETGIQVLGGHLVSGTVFACELTIECFDDLALDRVRDAATGLSLWRPPPPAAAWAAVAASAQAIQQQAAPVRPATAPVRRTPPAEETLAPVITMPLPEKKKLSEEQFFAEPIPQIGDWVEHKQFGLCRVDAEDEDGGLVIRLPSGVRKTISLDYLRVLPPRQDGERRIYPLEPRGSRR